MDLYRAGRSPRDRAVHVHRRRSRAAPLELVVAATFRLARDYVLAGARHAGALPDPVWRLLRGVCGRAAVADSTSDSLYASRSQSVIGASTSSRCVTRITCTDFNFDARSTRRICGALTVRARKMHSSRKFRLGRTKK